MKQWVKKLIEQFEVDAGTRVSTDHTDVSEDRATLLYLLDIYSKNLFETDKHPIRKVREVLDEFIKALIKSDSSAAEKVLFRLRQFLGAYRIDEYTFIQNTFEDFKHIIWDFADQLGEEVSQEKAADQKVNESLSQLREAVESNSIEELRTRSREFIDFYVEQQTRRDERRDKNLSLLQTNLASVRKKLSDANQKMHIDHLTKAHNRMSFDEHSQRLYEDYRKNKTPVSLVVFDLDHFKKVNDTFGHDVGDVVLKECVQLMKTVFNEQGDILARTGGEEFAVLLAGTRVEKAIVRAESALERVRHHVVVSGSFQVRFTVSMGIAELMGTESLEMWVKRADSALYESKTAGRDRYTVAPPPHLFAA